MQEVAGLLVANPAVFAVVAGLFGLLVGSFLNVVIHRLPIMMDRQWAAHCAELAAEGSSSSAQATARHSWTDEQARLVAGLLPPAPGEIWVMDVSLEDDDGKEVRYRSLDIGGESRGAPRVLSKAAFEATFAPAGVGYRLLVRVLEVGEDHVEYQRLDAARRPLAAPRRAPLIVFMASFTAEGAEHVSETLTGTLIWAGWREVIILGAVYAAIGAFHWVFRRRMLAASFQPHAESKLKTWDFLFYVTLGLVISFSVEIAGVLLARRSDIGMGKNPFRRDCIPGDDIQAQRLDGGHLDVREIGIIEFVAGIVNLDADRAGVDVVVARPVRRTRVPGTLRLAHHLRDAAGLVDEIVT